jgi:CHAT domain-containing protein/Tfp pilus assembly protein PilF
VIRRSLQVLSLIVPVLAVAPASAELTVVNVAAGGTASQSGLEPGDRILAVRAGDEDWSLVEQPLDLHAIDFTLGRIGPLELRLATGEGRREVKLPLGDLGLIVVPGDGSLSRAAEMDVRRRLGEGRLDEAVLGWTAWADSQALEPRMACWAQLRLVELLVEGEEIDRATNEAGALAAACKAAPVIDSVLARAAAAQVLRERVRDIDAMVTLLESADASAQETDPIVSAALAHDLGSFLGRRGRLDPAENALDRAIARYQGAAPNSWGFAESLANRGLLHAIRGQFHEARDGLSRALTMMERVAPDSLVVSMQQHNLATVMRRLGEPDRAQVLNESALAIRERLAPDSDLVAQSLNNLGILAKNRGNFVAAEAHYRRALEVRERINVSPLARASVLGNLANLALERLDPEASLVLHRQALDLLEPFAPGHRFVVATRLSLGQGELLRGRLDEAEGHLQAARSLQEAIGTDTPTYAAILETFARLERERKDPAAARSLLEQALDLHRRLDPQSLDAAAVELALGELDLAGERLVPARTRLMNAAAVAAARAPGSLVEARARHALAGVFWRTGDRAAALAADAAALDAFEAQREQLGGDWLQRMRFGADNRDLYLGAIERRLDAGGVEDAFALQERYRAFERRRLLAGRVPLPALDPVSTRVDELAAMLSGGEAVLSWVVGDRATHAFLLTADGLESRSLAIGELEWREELDSLGVLLSVARPTVEQREALSQRASRMFERLMTPWAESLAGIERLVLVPDQDLHRLPFAVLEDPHSGRYLVERHALIYAASASLYLAGPESGPELPGVLAVGDPQARSAGRLGAGPPGSAADSARDATTLSLPAARAEVEAIAGFFPERTLRLVGSAATEARVRAAMPRAGLLHLAAHAVVDGARPLDAYIQLAREADGQDDGRLAAWEVLTQLQIDAELVTLSACSTARGRTLGGDGVLGLSQAFQLAGARAVLASLWDVPDQATADLMAAFYQRLAAGQDAASALRAAQLEALSQQRAVGPSGFWQRLAHWFGREPDMSVGPFEWAAFKLDGRVARR